MPTTRTSSQARNATGHPSEATPDVEASRPASTWRIIPQGAEVDHPGEVPHGSGCAGVSFGVQGATAPASPTRW